ncbi:MAG: tetratricopeptide (TPR) repeat protein, partial [Planctomycetota bacterium]
MFQTGPGDVLHLAISELGKSNFSRAAARLRSWSKDSLGGPLAPSEASTLAREWKAGRLVPSLKVLKAVHVRRLLRRMDHALCDPATSVVHWEEARSLFRYDRISHMRHLSFQFKLEDDTEKVSVEELLEVARAFQEDERPMRAGPVLVMAAFLQPESANKQLALGRGLLKAGRTEEGSPWILAAVEELLSHDESDRALPALRELLAVNPRLREARQLYSRAKRNSTQVRRLRKHILIGSAGLAFVVGAAVVRVQNQSERGTQLGNVRMMIMSDPIQAMKLLETGFPESKDLEVFELKNLIREQQRAMELAKRTQWLETYNAASQECTQGDPIKGIDMALKVKSPPVLRLLTDPWPLEADLHNGLVETLQGRIEALGEPAEGDPKQVSGEEKIRRQLRQLTEIITELDVQTARTGELGAEFQTLIDTVDGRVVRRDELKVEREGQELRDAQDRLWQQANEHSKRGDFVRAARVYEELIASDVDGQITDLLADEIQSNLRRLEAVRDAQEAATAGDHDKSL